MRKRIKIAFYTLMVVLLLASCTSTKNEIQMLPSTSVSINYDKTAPNQGQLEFSYDEIKTAVEKTGSVVTEAGQWTVEIGQIDATLNEQAYKITVSGNKITIVGGDSDGLMYGALDVADQIKVGKGIQSVKNAEVTPFIKERGFKYHIPLDMRCPCYPSIGDSGIANIANAWDMEFWHEFIDTMARDRFNTLYLTNINPYPTLVKVAEYPDVAIDDVWAPTIAYDNSYSGALTGAVREEHWNNYEVVKKITIDEKIAFWQEVMEYGKQRGVGFYFRINHIHTYAEQGKYGIDDNIDNPVTKDYLSKSAQALIETYPLLKGLNINDGENMGWDNSEEGEMARWQWLHDVYVPAINNALAKDPDREFSLQGGYQLPDLFSDLNCTLIPSGGYTGVHMYATSTPIISQGAVASLRGDDANLVLSFRNEDCFDMRWGDFDFMKEFVSNMPSDKMLGYMTGSDGYCYQRDYSSTDPELQGILYLDKHWVNYMLLGRLSFNVNLTDEDFYALFDEHLGFVKDTDILWETTKLAGKIIPRVHKQYYQDNSDYTWYAAASYSHPDVGGYIDIKRFMRSTNIFPYGDCISIEKYCIAINNSEEIDEALVTPIETATMLREYGEGVLANIAQIRKDVKKPRKPTRLQKEFWTLVEDDEAMAYLALFYSEKFLGAVDLRRYNDTENKDFQASSVEHLKKASEYFNQHAAIISKNYIPQHLARFGDFDINAIAKEVEGDIALAQSWKPRFLPPSTNAPTKSEYFSKNN